jgi:hypothetical protein
MDLEGGNGSSSVSVGGFQIVTEPAGRTFPDDSCTSRRQVTHSDMNENPQRLSWQGEQAVIYQRPAKEHESLTGRSGALAMAARPPRNTLPMHHRKETRNARQANLWPLP